MKLTLTTQNMTTSKKVFFSSSLTRLLYVLSVVILYSVYFFVRERLCCVVYRLWPTAVVCDMCNAMKSYVIETPFVFFIIYSTATENRAEIPISRPCFYSLIPQQCQVLISSFSSSTFIGIRTRKLPKGYVATLIKVDFFPTWQQQNT